MREAKSLRSYHWIFGVTATAACLILYFIPLGFAESKGFVFFAGLAVLMEFLEVQLPKFPRILVVESLYIATLFLFPLPLVLGLILIGSLGRFIYSLRVEVPGILLLIRRLLIFGSSVALFQMVRLQGAFQAFQGKPFVDQAREIGGQLGAFMVWVIGYSVVQFVLSYGEKMILRGTVKIAPSWPSFGRSIVFNLLLTAPLGLLMYILYQLQPLPFPFPLILLIPSLLVIYRSIKNYTESLEAAKATIEALAEAVDKRLEFTHDHSPNVSRLTHRVAMAMGLSDEEVELVERAARIHNLGKVGIADRILNKKEALTEEEFKIIKKHPEIGAKVASQLSVYEREVEIIRSHHEHYDGTGYPRGLKEGKIPMGARIIAVADAFVAMTSERPYRKARTPAEAVEEIKKGSGSVFDPKVVEAFLSVMEKEESLST